MNDPLKQIRDVLGNHVNGDIHGAAEAIVALLAAPPAPEPESAPPESPAGE